MEKYIDYLFIIRGLPYNTKNGAINKQMYHIANFLLKYGYKIAILSLVNPMKDFDRVYSTQLSNKLSIKLRLIYYINDNKILGKIFTLFLKLILNNNTKINVYKNINILNTMNIKNIITPYWWGTLLANEYFCKDNIYYIIYHDYANPNAINSEFESAGVNENVAKKFILKSYECANKIAGSKSISLKFLPTNVPIIREGIDILQYDGKIRPNKKKGFTIIMTLRGQEMKGAIYALKAAKLIHNQYSDINFESFGNYIGEVLPFIHHHGIISKRKLIRLYSKGKVFILPSLEEGLSEVLLEAMLNGNAIISTNAGDSKYVIKNYYNGILVPIKDEISIFNAVSYLYTHNDILLKLSYNAISTAKKYNISITDEDILLALKYYN